MRALMQRTAILLAVMFALNSGAFGYYYYVHFASRVAPYNPIYEKFDVNALKNKTVYFFISDNGPAQLANSDSFGALVSELRLAAKTWSDIDSSDLRVAFGGMATAGTPQNAPGIDVVFDDDIPPGIAALGGPTVRTDLATSASGNAFVPITRSTLKLRRDLRDLPSFSENGFTTLLHEFGHTLGLQHTLTSGTMSTAITRATTRSKPLSADDIAAMSVLYPSGAFLANTGSVSGRVTLGGSPVNLASVVAISSNGPAISALTNPDGTYNIQGIPAGQSYNLYVHPLPPKLASEAWPANIVPPKDPDGFPQPAGFNFDTVFFPGVKDPNQATSFFLNAGDAKSGMNFSVTRRDTPGLASIYTYGFYGSNPVYPAPLSASGTGVSLIAKGDGLVNGTSLAPGLTVSVLGQSGANVLPQSVKYYTSGYIVFGIAPTFGASPGARHLVFAANNDIYVLPAGVLIVSGPPPAISGVTPALDDRGNRAALISGSGLDSSTRIMFDGVAATLIRQNGDGSLLVTPPPAAGGFRSNIVALNNEGQSSLFVQPAPPAFAYDGTDVPGIISGLSALNAGAESMIEILGVNTAFVDGHTIPGFGSSDVSVRRVWVTGPNRLLANIAVSPAAMPAATEVTVASGLQLMNQPFAFQILPANARQVSMSAPISNAATGNAGVPAGGTAVVSVTNLTGTAGALGITVADQKATILAAANGQITFIVPPGLPVGPAVVRLQTPAGDPVPPLIMNIDPQPPQIIGAFAAPGTQADSSHPAFRGSLTGFLITGLPDPQTLPDPSVIRINVGGLDHVAVSLSSQPGGALAQILLNPAVAAGNQIPVTVSYNGAVSQPFVIPVR